MNRKRNDIITTTDVRKAIDGMTINNFEIDFALTDEECNDIANTAMENLKAAREKGLSIQITDAAINTGLFSLVYTTFKDRIKGKYLNL